MGVRFVSFFVDMFMAFTLLSGTAAPDVVIRLNETKIENYTIVYAEDAWDYGRDCAEYLADAIEDIGNVTLDVKPDSKNESEYEILIGDTNRSASEEYSSDKLSPMQYEYVSADGKIVINGELYLLEVAAEEIVGMLTPAQGKTIVNATVPTDAVVETFEFLQPKNFIFIIGDGMGTKAIEFAKDNGLSGFSAELFPYRGTQSTVNIDGDVTDSAASGTALATGYKTKNSRVGCLPDGSHIKNLGELAVEMGKDFAVLTTDSITGATPAAFTSHTTDRGNEAEIKAGQETCGAIVLEGSIPFDKTGDTLRAALDTLDKTGNENGFFMMYEEAYFDKGGHASDFDMVFGAATRMNETVKIALDYAIDHPDTFIILTADHETGGVAYSRTNGWEFRGKGSHTKITPPVFAIGYGAEAFNEEMADNTEISKFIAYLMGEPVWGDAEREFSLILPDMK